jgi:hypothetical protein
MSKKPKSLQSRAKPLRRTRALAPSRSLARPPDDIPSITTRLEHCVEKLDIAIRLIMRQSGAGEGPF